MRAWHSIIILFLLAPKASGQQLAKFVASDAAADDYFGYSVAISGDLVVVGAYGNDDAGSSSGSAYVFRTRNSGASWTQTAKFVASDAAADDYFGYSVAISGDLVVVGAYRDDDAGSKTGSAYVFRTTNDGGSWTQTAKLVASDAAKDNYFGKSVAISGDLVVVGADGRNEDVGSAYVFRTRNDGASWSQTAKLLASDAAKDDVFGESVAVSGDLVVVGAYGNDDSGSSSGSAYVFRTRNDGASWTQTAKLVASDAAAQDNFGYSVAISGDLVVVGAYEDDDAGSSSGSAYVLPADSSAVTPRPTPRPTRRPTPRPTRRPTPRPTRRPTPRPTRRPTPRPTPRPTRRPNPQPAPVPDPRPTRRPTPRPTPRPNPQPAPVPDPRLSPRPTRRPTPWPTPSPGGGGTSGDGTDMLVVVAAAVAGALVAVLACLCIKRRHGAPPERNVPFAPAWMAPGDGLETHSVEELKAMANARGVSLAGRLEKTDIIAALRAAAPVDAVAVPVDDASTGAWNVPGAASASTVPAAAVPSAPRPPPVNPGFAAAPRAPPLAVGARVAYDRDGAARLGVVVAVHNEDPSGPYYTVRLDGPVPRDVQTERGRLRLVATPPRIAGSASLPGRAA